MMRKSALMALAAIGFAGEAAAQRADQNAARAAEDAFGVSYAKESAGLYDEEDVRGFSPIDAGNVRIEACISISRRTSAIVS
jgi:iron complex outermembrane receptor protein